MATGVGYHGHAMVNPYEPPQQTTANAPRAAGRPDACHVCGTVLSQAALLYDEQGNVICQRCLMERQSAQGHGRVAARAKRVAYASLGLGVVSWLFNPFFLVSLSAIANALFVLRSVGDRENSTRLEGSSGGMKAAAIAGIVLGGLSAALRLAWTFASD